MHLLWKREATLSETDSASTLEDSFDCDVCGNAAIDSCCGQRFCFLHLAEHDDAVDEELNHEGEWTGDW